MGMYDCVLVPCPVCGIEEYFQSKGGYCILEHYTLDEAPVDVLMDVNRHSPYECKNCGALFEVEVKIYTEAKSVLSKVIKEEQEYDE